jgi:hypothetical protein
MNPADTQDYIFGEHGEIKALSTLQSLFGKNIQKAGGSSTFDFTDGKVFIELKCRRCYSYDYDDTMVGYNKVALANRHPEHRYIFCFRFIDGLFYVEHTHGETYRVAHGGRNDRGRPEYKPYSYIKKELLIKI